MKIIQWMNKNLEECLMITLLAAMTLIMGIQICARYLFNYSLSWSEEITRFLFIWAGFLSISYCTTKCISIKIEQLILQLKPRMRTFVKVINHSVELLFFIYLLPFSWSYLEKAITSQQTSPACNLPMYFVQSAPFVCFLLAAFRILQRWLIEFKMVRKGE